MKKIALSLMALCTFTAMSPHAEAAVVEYYSMPGSSCVYDTDPQTNCNFRVGPNFFLTGTNVVNVTLKNSCYPEPSRNLDSMHIITQGLGYYDTSDYMLLRTTVPYTQDIWYNNNGTFTVQTQFKPWALTEVQKYSPTTARVALRYTAFSYVSSWGSTVKQYRTESVPKSCIVTVELVKYGKGPGR